MRVAATRRPNEMTAEDVGLELPEPKVNVVEVDMSAAQDAKYERYVGQIEAALESSRSTDKSKILGLLARMALVAIRPDLDEGYDWKTAASSGVDPSSPKFRCSHFARTGTGRP